MCAVTSLHFQVKPAKQNFAKLQILQQNKVKQNFSICSSPGSYGAETIT